MSDIVPLRKKQKSELEKEYEYEIAHMNQTCKDQEMISFLKENTEDILKVFKLQENIIECINNYFGESDLSEENLFIIIRMLLTISKNIRDGLPTTGDEYKKRINNWIKDEFDLETFTAK